MPKIKALLNFSRDCAIDYPFASCGAKILTHYHAISVEIKATWLQVEKYSSLEFLVVNELLEELELENDLTVSCSSAEVSDCEFCCEVPSLYDGVYVCGCTVDEFGDDYAQRYREAVA